MAQIFFLSLLFGFYFQSYLFLATSYAQIPELIFLDIFQWMKFIVSFCICATYTYLIFGILHVLWFYEFFLEILCNPDRGIWKSSRKLQRHVRFTGRFPIQAYSVKYFIFSCYQLQASIDNGYSTFLDALSHTFSKHQTFFLEKLFSLQSKFFPSFPSDGPIFFYTTSLIFLLINFLSSTISFLFIFSMRLYSIFLNLAARYLWSLDRRWLVFRQTWINFSCYLQNKARINVSHNEDTVFFTDEEVIACCFKSNREST